MRPDPRAPTSTRRSKLLLGALSLLLSLGLAEGAVRALCTTDEDGTARFRGAALHPYHLPIHAVEAKVAEYLALPSPRAVHDPDLGWTYPAGYTSADGLYHYDERVVRSAPGAGARALSATPGTMRIALFGDSFTHGDSVPFAATWGAKLEAGLRAAGVAAEVLNFGVGGYGMDQAFLRFRKLGRPLRPEVVVFGFQPENVGRNLNIVRPLYYQRTDLPFTKPRFVSEGGALRVVNVPTVPPQALPALLRDFASWEHAPYEGSIVAADYEDHPWLKSRVVALGLDLLARRSSAPEEEARFDPTGEQGGLALALVAVFAADVRASGARFVVVHLPRPVDLAALRAGRPLPYAALLREIRERYQLVDPAEGLLRAAASLPEGALFADEMGHYAEPGHAAVAAAVSARLASPGP